MDECTIREAFRFNVNKAKEQSSKGTADGDFASAALYYSAAMDAACLKQDHKPFVTLSKQSRQAYDAKAGTVYPPCPEVAAVPGAPAVGPTGKPIPAGQVPDRLPATLQVDPEKGDNPEIKPLIPSQLGVTMDMVAGNTRAKRLLREILINPFNFPQQYPDGILIDGMLLYGVAGTGKTTITSAAAKSIEGKRTPAEVQALRNKTEIPGFVDKYFPSGEVPKVLFFPASVSDITSMYVGEPARKIKRFFQMARAAQPAVIFFDEGETYLDPANQHNSGTITTFKQELGGIESKKEIKDVVVVILATNYPMKVESAIRSRLGPGAIEIALPDFPARAKIAEINFKKGAWKATQAAARQKLAGAELLADPPTPLVEFPEDMANYIACRTLPPNQSNAGRAPWSGRDVESLVKTAYLANRSRVLGGFVKECTSDCKYYPGKSFSKAFQEVGMGQINTALGSVYTTEDQITAANRTTLTSQGIVAVESLTTEDRFRVLISPLGRLDIDEAFERVGSTVDKGAIRDQLEYNQELGEVVTTQGFWQKLYQNPEKPVPVLLGTNTTVPIDDNQPVGVDCATTMARLKTT